MPHLDSVCGDTPFSHFYSQQHSIKPKLYGEDLKLKRRFLLTIVTLLLLILVSTACASEPSFRTIQLHEVTRSVFYAPQYVAISKGYFEEAGLHVVLTTSGGSDKAMTALLAGQADRLSGHRGPIDKTGRLFFGEPNRRSGSVFLGVAEG